MTLLIKDVMILGGDRDVTEKSDVFVTNDKISAIGNFASKNADVVLDGQGAYLSPGFIDVNTDSDHYLSLFDYPGQEDFLKQGVTTIFGGMCGSSLAPLLYGSLESIRKWTDPNKVNVNWHTVGEFLKVLDKQPLAVNFGTLAGHSTIRRGIVGDAIRDLTKNELNVFSETLQLALKEGAFGLSTGLEYVHARKTPYAELKALANIVKNYGGIYATHLRDMGAEMKASVDETIKLAKETGVSTIISHFVPATLAAQQYEASLEAIDKLPGEMQFRFDLYPSEGTLFPLYTFLPAWAQTGGMEVMLNNAKDEWTRARLIKDIASVNEDNFVIASAPGNDVFVGKSLRQVREMYELKDPREALTRLMVAVGMEAVILYKSLDPKLIRRAIADKRSFVASNAPSFSDANRGKQLKSERTTSTFTGFLSLVAKENLMSLHDAIRKITREPALAFGLKGRGEIKEGNFADLVCFKEDSVKFTIVNGVLTMRDGQFTKEFPGKVFRHSAR